MSENLPKEEKEIEHEYTNEIVCPYCGYECSDSWEFDSNNNCGTHECGDCGEEFEWERNIDIDYSTSKICKPCKYKMIYWTDERDGKKYQYKQCEVCGKRKGMYEVK